MQITISKSIDVSWDSAFFQIISGESKVKDYPFTLTLSVYSHKISKNCSLEELKQIRDAINTLIGE